MTLFASAALEAELASRIALTERVAVAALETVADSVSSLALTVASVAVTAVAADRTWLTRFTIAADPAVAAERTARTDRTRAGDAVTVAVRVMNLALSTASVTLTVVLADFVAPTARRTVAAPAAVADLIACARLDVVALAAAVAAFIAPTVRTLTVAVVTPALSVSSFVLMAATVAAVVDVADRMPRTTLADAAAVVLDADLTAPIDR
ncbi:MAG TPA: hypothetical protein VIP10_12520 [Burkholderiaceae bacterium]